jgi:hypothetical protein
MYHFHSAEIVKEYWTDLQTLVITSKTSKAKVVLSFRTRLCYFITFDLWKSKEKIWISSVFFQNEALVNSLPREVLFLKNWFSSTATTKDQLSLLKEYEEKVFEEDPELIHCNTPSFIEVCQRTRLPLAMIHYIYTKVSTTKKTCTHNLTLFLFWPRVISLLFY